LFLDDLDQVKNKTNEDGEEPIDEINKEEGGEQKYVDEMSQLSKRAPLPHKTCSIHFRTVPVAVPLAEIENVTFENYF
jgi:hypothetical protein